MVPMDAILYNCCSVTRDYRLLNILETLRADAVMLTGMRYRMKSTLKTPYETVRVGRYTGYIWGYAGGGALTNKSAGVGIFLSRKLREKNVVEIASPDPWLQGRVGMFRIKGPQHDVAAIVAYPLPDTGKKQT